MTMQQTVDTRTDPASQRIDNELREHFGSEVTALDRVAERAAATIAAERKKLTRPDGSPVFMPQEHAERDTAILQAATAQYDAVAEGVAEEAGRARTEAERQLAALEADPFERLSEADQARANLRRAFIAEDCQTLRPDQLLSKAKAALAAQDRALSYLYGRYLARRLEAEPGRASVELLAVARELAEAVADPKARETAERLRRKVNSSKVLDGRIDLARRRIDGRHDAMLAGMRRQFSL